MVLQSQLKSWLSCAYKNVKLNIRILKKKTKKKDKRIFKLNERINFF